MRFLFYGILGLVCLALAVATFLFVAGPSDLMRDQLVQAVKERTGRDLVIAGSGSFTLFPRIGLALTDVSLSDPPQMGDSTLVQVARLEVATTASALLRQQLSLDQITLRGAIIDLRVTADGQRNWELAPPSSRRAAIARPIQVAAVGDVGTEVLRLAQAARAVPASASQAEATRAASAILALFGDVHVVESTVRYRNDVTGRREEISGISGGAKLQPGTGRLMLGGRGTWRRERVDVQATISSLPELIDNASPVAVKLKSAHGELQLEGTLATAPIPQLTGKLKSSAPGGRALANWLAAPLPAGPGIGAVAVAGAVTANANSLTIKDLVATIDETTVKGEVGLGFDNARPQVRGVLAIDRLDLNSLGLMAAPAGTSKPGKAQKSEPSGVPKGGGGIGGLIESIEKPPAPAAGTTSGAASPQVRGWSSEPMDVGVLRLVDAELRFDIGQLAYRETTVERAKGTVGLREGVLKAAVQEAALYKGRGSGVLDLDATTAQVKFAVQSTLEGVDTFALLNATSAGNRIAGRGTVVLKLAGLGLTQHQLAETLSGTAAVTIADGAVIGFSVPNMVRQAQRGQLPQGQFNAAEKTDFSELSGTFAISNGVAQSQDLKVVSPSLRASGSGAIDIGKQAIDLRLRPKLTAAAGVPGGIDLSGIEVPVIVRGPWDSPRAAVDLDSLAKDPSAVKKGVEKLGEILNSKEGKEAAKEIGSKLKQLLGR